MIPNHKQGSLVVHGAHYLPNNLVHLAELAPHLGVVRAVPVPAVIHSQEMRHQ